MKHKLLLVGAFLMACASLSAQSFTANRQKVVPETTTWAMEKLCYLWNVGAQGFYTNHQGAKVDPYWATRAVVSDTIGQQVRFTRTNPSGTDEVWDQDGVLETTCLLTSYVSYSEFSPSNGDKFYCTFAADWNGIWTDNDGQAYRYFNVIDNGATIKIERNIFLDEGTGSPNEGKYLGILASDPDKTVKLHDTEPWLDDEEVEHYNIDPSAEFYEDWAVVTPEAYEAWVAAGGKEAGKVYDAAASLKRALETAYAENPGINTLDNVLAVYNNEAATVEELQAAEALIPGQVTEWIKISGGGSPDEPLDFTKSIVNPTFDVIGDFHGWSFGEGTKQFGAGGTPSTCAEVWRGSFDAYQDISGLPGGVYILSAKGYCRYNDNHVDDYNDWKAGNPSHAKLYMSSPTAGRFSTSVKHISQDGSLDYSVGGAGNTVDAEIDGVNYTLYTPNNMAEANAYFHEEGQNRYYNEVIGSLEDGEVLRIGATNTITADWNVFDDFELKYIGDEVESYQYWGKKMAENNPVSFEGSFYGAPEKDAYDAAVATLSSATDKDAIIAAISGYETVVENVATSKANYKTYIETCEKVLEWLTTADEKGYADPEGYIGKLADYMQADAGEVDEAYPNGVLRSILPYDDGEGAGKLSAEEILTEDTYVNELWQNAIRTGLVPGADLTDLIVNPSFEEPLASNGWAKGWSFDDISGKGYLQNWRGGATIDGKTVMAAEAYEQMFDVYQILNDVPNGLYKVSVQAYYRTGSNENAYAAYLEDPDMVGLAKVYTYVYFNDFSQPVKNSMEILYPENLANNCVAVGTDDEGNSLYCLNGMASAATAFNYPEEERNFTQNVYGLVTDGKIRLGIRNLENKGGYTWSLWDNFKLTYMGKDEDALREVIENYIERIDALGNYGEPEKQVTEAAKDKYATAEDGDALYDALVDIVAAYNNDVKSAKLYEDAATVLDELSTAFEEYQNTASEEARDAANEAVGKYEEALSYYQYSIDEVNAAIEDMKALISDLKIPADINDGSDDNPIDLTSLIVNPSYDDGNSNGWEGSVPDHSRYNRQDMVEYYQGTFDHHQTLKNLPAGTYELKVNCFNRIPSTNAQTDYNTFMAGEKNNVMAAFVYATVGDQTFAEPFRMISEGARETPNFSSTSTINAIGGTTLYTPNNMTAAGTCFEETDPETDEPLSDEMNYVVRVVFTLTEKGDVTIGCKNSDGNTWAIWDNWNLTYFGTESQKENSGDATGVVEIQNAASVVSSEIFTVGGARIAAPQRGLNIIKTKMSDGTVKVQKVIIK